MVPAMTDLFLARRLIWINDNRGYLSPGEMAHALLFLGKRNRFVGRQCSQQFAR